MEKYVIYLGHVIFLLLLSAKKKKKTEIKKHFELWQQHPTLNDRQLVMLQRKQLSADKNFTGQPCRPPYPFPNLKDKFPNKKNEKKL